MSRASTLWPVLAVIVVVTILGFAGYNTLKRSKSSVAKTLAKTPPTPPVDEHANWFKSGVKPSGALLISGELGGYLEPCGCTEGQQGGLGRRYTLFEQLRAKGWPLAKIDLGSLADPPGARGGPIESRLKFSVALRALAAMNYSAVALSADDLKLGVLEVLGMYLNLSGEPKILAANIVPAEGFETAIQPSFRTSAGPIKIGVTAVIDPGALQALNDSDKELLKVKAPSESLPAVRADLEKDTDVQVLMVQGPAKLAKELARAFPSFELVVATSELADPEAQPEMLNEGRTALIQVGKRGKFVCVVGMFQGPELKLRYHRVDLNRSYKQAEPIQKLIDDELQNELKTLKVVEDFAKHDYVGGAPGTTYIGAESCKTCHPKTYARWASTKHSLAYAGLTKPERNREFDAECASCHTTGFEYTSGFRSAELTPYLKGNQCENCHGPGSKHAAEPDNAAYRKLMAQPVANPEQNHFCYRCHDEDNSPNFNFTKYYPQIIHMGMDTYEDHKVHEGIVPGVATSSR